MSEKYVDLDKRFFVGLPLDRKYTTEKDVISGCIKLHHETKLLMIPFLEIKTELPEAPAPTTYAAFTNSGLVRLCGFIFDEESMATDFLKTNKELVKIPIEKSRFLTMSHQGKFEQKDNVWKTIFGILDEKNLKKDPTFTYETYVVNELHSTDPRDWITEMYQPILQ